MYHSSMTNTSQAYYQSHSKLNFIGAKGQVKLAGAKVLVIGAGGLGCPCLLYLAGCGIGTIGIADFDTVSLSNLHRQGLYSIEDIGQPKAAIAKKRLLQHNPHISINEHQFPVDQSNVLELMAQYDVVVDGTDNFAVRYLINDACVYLNKPLIYGAIYQTEGHVTVFNYHQSATLRCLFPEAGAESFIPSCADVGAYNIITGMIGTLMAGEVVKVILQNSEVLANKLVMFDALAVSFRAINYKQDPKNRAVSMARFKEPEAVTDISPEEFLALPRDAYELIDVREDWERDEHHIGGQHIPLHSINNHDFSALLKHRQLIFYCQQGTRSSAAVQILRKAGYSQARSLRGGLNALDD